MNDSEFKRRLVKSMVYGIEDKECEEICKKLSRSCGKRGTMLCDIVCRIGFYYCYLCNDPTNEEIEKIILQEIL